MLTRIVSEVAHIIHHPSIISWKCREWIDRNSEKRRQKAAKEFLEEKNIWPLMTAGDSSEIPAFAPDLANLYRLITQRRPKVVLELGVGFSTLVISAALRSNFDESNVQGHLYSVDSEIKWIENTTQKIPADLQEYVSFHHSPVSIKMVDNTLCHIYESLPDISQNLCMWMGPAEVVQAPTFVGRFTG